MARYCSCLVFVALVQVIFGEQPPPPRELHHLGFYHPYQQMIPRHCWHPPHDIDLHKCCPKPNLYTDEVYDSCGVEKYTEKRHDIPARPKTKKVPCQDGTCLMTKANLLMANGSIDYEKFATYIDQWALANPDFTEAIMLAKPLCAKPKGPLWYIGRPPNMCDPDRVFLCLQTHIFWNCKLKEFEECKRLREHIDECKPYYGKPEGYDEIIANLNKNDKKITMIKL